MAGLHPNFQTPGIFKLPDPIVLTKPWLTSCLMAYIRGSMPVRPYFADWRCHQGVPQGVPVPKHLAIDMYKVHNLAVALVGQNAG